MLPKFTSWQKLICLVALLVVASCAWPVPATVYGLRPEYPEVHYNVFGGIKVIFWGVDSLQPTFRWESFPRPQDHEADKEGKLSRIQNVTYDLKIWRVENDHVAELIYMREGLPEPSHKIEELLEPSTNYFWSIRARFELDGDTRVTEWGLTKYPWYPGPSPRTLARRLGRIPNPNYYRFRTSPAKAEKGTVAPVTPEKKVSPVPSFDEEYGGHRD